jgi:hypothetical protein
MALIETGKQTGAQLVLQILNIFILKFKYQCSKHITTCTNFIKKFKHLYCKCQSVSKIDGQRNQEVDGPGSGLVDQGRDQGAGVRVRAAGSGSAPGRQGRGVGVGLGWWQALAWLVPGAERRARAASTFGRRLGRRQWHGRWVVAVFGAVASGSGRCSGATDAGIGVGLGTEVRASDQSGGQPGEETDNRPRDLAGEERGRARGGDGRPTSRSG